MPNVGINGFCRIGRIVLRTCLEHPEIQVTAINDPAIDIEYICYLIKFDSTHGRYLDGDVIARKHLSEIKIKDITIKIYHEKLPANIPWQLANVQYVVESSGMFTTLEKASGHLANGVQQVLVTAPSVNIPMFIMGVNEQQMNSEHRVVSTTSSTLYCLAPIVKILEDNFGVSEGFITSVHAMTPSLKPLDGLCLRGKYWRDHRSIHQNIIPAATGACKALGKIIPSLKDKLAGTAFRVPIVNVSILDITIRLNTPTSLNDILVAIEKQSTTNLKSIIRISNEEAVSSDFMNESCSCVVDAVTSIQLRPNFFKIICWYENEYSYACRVVDSILFTEKYIKLKLELNSNILASIVLSRIPENEYDIQPKSPKFKLNDLSHESGDKNKTHLRFPKRHSDKDYDVSTATEKMVTIYSNTKEDGSNTEVGHIIENNTCGQLKEEEKLNTSVINQKTFIKTLSSVRIFQAQQERLEKVKKEFEKVASFTEDLLNKTKMFNDKLLCLSNESLNNLKDNNVNSPDEVDSNLTYVKYDATSDSKLLRSSECSEELRNWNYEVTSHSHTSEDNQNLEDTVIKTEDTVVVSKSNEGFVKKSQASEIEILDKVKNEDKESLTKDFETGFTVDDIFLANCCYENVMRDIEDEIKVTTGHGSYFDTVNQNKYENITAISTETFDKFDAIKPDIPSASKMGTMTANTLYSKIELAKDSSDLYDKLDSESNTGSESSFREKKSQIIKFSDLSQSMDELEKIDQFCRIIEISDEISDNLFAALSNNGMAPKTEWSFGELCKKINLGDFCKKVFKNNNSHNSSATN